MERKEELDLFIEKANDMITSKYILADIKIANLLKTIAISPTILALFKNCLLDFDYEDAKSKYLVSNKYIASDKGEFVMPSSSKELLAFVLTILYEIDAKTLDLSLFLNKFFYENGSCTLEYDRFINSMIKPFVNLVKVLMESVIEGKIQDPLEAITEQEKKEQKEKKETADKIKKEKELSKKQYGESLNKIKAELLAEKKRIKECGLKDEEKKSCTLVIDMFANAIEGENADAIVYSFTAYRYMAKAHKKLFFGKIKKIQKWTEDVLGGLSE